LDTTAPMPSLVVEFVAGRQVEPERQREEPVDVFLMQLGIMLDLRQERLALVAVLGAAAAQVSRMDEGGR